MRENINNTEEETKHASVEDSLNMHRIASNETTLISEIPDIIIEENVIIAPRQGKIVVSISSDQFCKEQAYQVVCYGEFWDKILKILKKF